MRNRKKVLIVGTLTDAGNGSARSYVRICNLMQSYFDVVAVAPDDRGVMGDIDWRIKVVVDSGFGPVRRSLVSIARAPVACVRFYILLYRIKPDLVHINDVPWFYLLVPAKFFGVRVVIHSRYFEYNRVARYFIRRFLKLADAIVHVSDYNKKAWGVKGAKAVTIHNPGVFDFVPPDRPVTLPDNYLLVVARVSEEKGVHNAIEMFAEVAAFDDTLALVVAGGVTYDYQAGYKSRCVDRLNELGLAGRVHWLGKVESPHYLYRKTRAFVHLPEFEDPFPTTIMESLVFAPRTITSRKGGIPEQVDKVSSALLLDDSQHWPIDRVLEFLYRDQFSDADSDRYHKMFGVSAFSEALLGVYSAITGERKSVVSQRDD